MTRQALNERVRRGTLLGLPGRRVTWFPIWQFDIPARQIRPVTPELLRGFTTARLPFAPLEIAGWATHARDDLGGISPADWLASNEKADPVIEAAEHTVAHLNG